MHACVLQQLELPLEFIFKLVVEQQQLKLLVQLIVKLIAFFELFFVDVFFIVVFFIVIFVQLIV